MSPKEKTSAQEIPIEVLRRFESIGGIPSDVVAELFTRMKLPPELQERFWQKAREKQYHCIGGKVSNIRTSRSGKTRVTIDSTATGDPPAEGEDTPLENYFYGPEEFTDEQLQEFKRAQSAKLCVEVCFQFEDGKRVIQSVDVFGCP